MMKRMMSSTLVILLMMATDVVVTASDLDFDTVDVVHQHQPQHHHKHTNNIRRDLFLEHAALPIENRQDINVVYNATTENDRNDGGALPAATDRKGWALPAGSALIGLSCLACLFVAYGHCHYYVCKYCFGHRRQQDENGHRHTMHTDPILYFTMLVVNHRLRAHVQDEEIIAHLTEEQRQKVLQVILSKHSKEMTTDTKLSPKRKQSQQQQQQQQEVELVQINKELKEVPSTDSISKLTKPTTFSSSSVGSNSSVTTTDNNEEKTTTATTAAAVTTTNDNKDSLVHGHDDDDLDIKPKSQPSPIPTPTIINEKEVNHQKDSMNNDDEEYKMSNQQQKYTSNRGGDDNILSQDIELGRKRINSSLRQKDEDETQFPISENGLNGNEATTTTTATLPPSNYSGRTSDGVVIAHDDQDDDVCPICLGSYYDEENDNDIGTNNMLFVSKECDHKFHMECILEWLKIKKHNNCPTCRVQVVSDKEIIKVASSMLDMKQIRNNIINNKTNNINSIITNNNNNNNTSNNANDNNDDIRLENNNHNNNSNNS